jgi:hypothetical protein
MTFVKRFAHESSAMQGSRPRFEVARLLAFLIGESHARAPASAITC